MQEGSMHQDWNHREVITVTGLIRPEQMGITYPHEHLFLDAMDHYPGYGYQLVIDDEDIMAKEMLEFTSRGGRTVCDVTLDEIGRDPVRLARFAKRAGIQVLMGCGWYRDFGYPPIVAEKSSRELAEVLVREIEIGVGETGHSRRIHWRNWHRAALHQAGRRTGLSSVSTGAGAHRRGDHHAHHALGHAGHGTDGHARGVRR